MSKIKIDSVFKNVGYSHSMSLNSFLGLTAIFTIAGLALNAIIAQWAVASGFQVNTLTFVLAIIVSFGGIFVSRSDVTIIKLLGYAMISVPFGFLLGPVVAKANPEVLMHVLNLTGVITVIMAIAGVLLPEVFSKIGGALFVALLGLVIVRILAIFIPALNAFGIIDYFAAGLFSLYIGYDMHRATVVERTLNNAIDIAIALYLDILNLFLTLYDLFD
jgi:uncharacterized protein